MNYNNGYASGYYDSNSNNNNQPAASWQGPPPPSAAQNYGGPSSASPPGGQAPLGFNIQQQSPAPPPLSTQDTNTSMHSQQTYGENPPVPAGAYDDGYQGGGPQDRGIKDFFYKTEQQSYIGPDGHMVTNEQKQFDWKKAAIGGLAAAGVVYGVKKFTEHRKEKKMETQEEYLYNSGHSQAGGSYQQSHHHNGSSSFYQSNPSQYHNIGAKGKNKFAPKVKPRGSRPSQVAAKSKQAPTQDKGGGAAAAAEDEAASQDVPIKSSQGQVEEEEQQQQQVTDEDHSAGGVSSQKSPEKSTLTSGIEIRPGSVVNVGGSPSSSRQVRTQSLAAVAPPSPADKRVSVGGTAVATPSTSQIKEVRIVAPASSQKRGSAVITPGRPVSTPESASMSGASRKRQSALIASAGGDAEDEEGAQSTLASSSSTTTKKQRRQSQNGPVKLTINDYELEDEEKLPAMPMWYFCQDHRKGRPTQAFVENQNKQVTEKMRKASEGVDEQQQQQSQSIRTGGRDAGDGDSMQTTEIGEAAGKRKEGDDEMMDVKPMANKTDNLAAQVRVVDGKVVLDIESVMVSRMDMATTTEGEPRTLIDESNVVRYVNSMTYVKMKGTRRRWTKEETDQFYQSLRKWGSDFEMIAKDCPGRTRSDVKTKFKREEKHHPDLVTDAILRR
ncbi:hypothetical protein EV182_002207 [Spiromyces aspiralis]|uniref:Uncharacterized protein n=1 Tax=Spiromyces aspiralis TaxID=68401 RepID=A0ACC1HHX9_9FUNG|nr:hypothetical protein EV182_002207 [Spiromyces aspiralis]